VCRLERSSSTARRTRGQARRLSASYRARSMRPTAWAGSPPLDLCIGLASSSFPPARRGTQTNCGNWCETAALLDADQMLRPAAESSDDISVVERSPLVPSAAPGVGLASKRVAPCAIAAPAAPERAGGCDSPRLPVHLARGFWVGVNVCF
jgi:hypothetical protein